MSKLTVLKTCLKKFTPTAVGVGLVTLAGSASAADMTGSITTAVTEATTNVGAVATGLIAIAAVMMGIGIVVSALKR
jgi:predicted outer membrane protein